MGRGALPPLTIKSVGDWSPPSPPPPYPFPLPPPMTCQRILCTAFRVKGFFSEVEVYSAQRSNILTKLIPFQNLHRLSENIHRNISQIPPAPHPASPNKSLAKAAIKGSDRLLFPRGARGFQKNVMYQKFPHPPRKKKERNKITPGGSSP